VPKIFIISDNTWLEILLKQHFANLIITTGSQAVTDADIIINNDVNINIKSLERTWLLAKPISIINMINIIEQAMRLLSDNIITIGPISFYPREKICKFAEEEIALTQKESEILLYLSKQDKGVDKLTLLHSVWGYSSEISTHTLETHIYKLRNKFSDKYDIVVSDENGYSLSF
jgi:DNA-binding response OmpR family regulator